MQTNLYDINISFEPQHDSTPRLYAYTLYRDHNADWNVDTQSLADSYYFTREEAMQLANNLGQEDFYDLQLDDWFDTHTESGYIYKNLPNTAKVWIRNLAFYTPFHQAVAIKNTREEQHA